MSWHSSINGQSVASLGLMAAATVGIYIGIRELLKPYHAANINYPPLPKTQYITQDTEDSLSLATLEKLLKHYNFSIRETAAKIVCDRAINDDDVLLVLLLGITRRDYDERMKNLRALAMLTDQHTLHRLNTVEGISAFVKSLEQCVLTAEPDPDADPNESMIDDISFDEYYLRDIAEKLCLMFLAQLTEKFDVDLVVRFGFVRRWLAKQPWGPPAKRIDNFARYLKYRDNRIADICRRLRDSPSGRRALEKYGLVAPRQPLQPKLLQSNLRAAAGAGEGSLSAAAGSSSNTAEGDTLRGMAAVEAATDNSLGDMTTDAMIQAARDVLTVLDAVVSANSGRAPGEGDTGDDASPTSTTTGSRAGQPRPHSQNSREEQRIRRQHREAMVLNDGTRPLRRDDIIERDSDSG
ncbi:hypothetical protein SBRCBS47491_000587 [Sporothrix bragantina]|uniref:Cytoskeleton-associated protein n=1 Tax=Sporothrix bragantina TaxID=671064 RepID=A0ABP0ARS0_9PEZI